MQLEGGRGGAAPQHGVLLTCPSNQGRRDLDFPSNLMGMETLKGKRSAPCLSPARVPRGQPWLEPPSQATVRPSVPLQRLSTWPPASRLQLLGLWPRVAEPSLSPLGPALPLRSPRSPTDLGPGWAALDGPAPLKGCLRRKQVNVQAPPKATPLSGGLP